MSLYAFMTKAKFDEVESELVHGVRYSLDGSQVVAKLADGQQTVSRSKASRCRRTKKLHKQCKSRHGRRVNPI
jgi:hypothetical protein